MKQKRLKCLLVAVMLLGGMTCMAQYRGCDTNHDGNVDITDVTNVVNAVLGKSGSNDVVESAETVEAQFAKVQQDIADKRKEVDAALKPNANGREGYFVDLGLSVKWASRDIGAVATNGYGNYYAWGECRGWNMKGTDYPASAAGTDWNGAKNSLYAQSIKDSKVKTNFAEAYKWSNDVGSMTQYRSAQNPTLLAADDAARFNWGGDWRMPTKEEVDELVNMCYWKYTDNYLGSGVAGWIVYKAKSVFDVGKHIASGTTDTPVATYSTNKDTYIFLPMSGVVTSDNVSSKGTQACYWTSSLYTNPTNVAKAYSIKLTKNSGPSVEGYDRRYGCTVRAVLP